MPAPSKPPVLKAAQPVHGQSFDPWNASSSGHQRAENRLGASTGWRESRNRKLMSQFTGGPGGGKRVSDTVGAGSQHWDREAKALVTPEARSRARNSVLDMLVRPGTMRSSSSPVSSVPASGFSEGMSGSSVGGTEERLTAEERKTEDDEQSKRRRRGIFDGVVVYVNGSTHPLISDHKLKLVLAEHGASMSSHLGRRKVTHVILGRPASGGYGSGGGLAGGKLQREISKIGGPGLKYVSVQWVLESIKAGKRLPEARFVDLKIAPKAQQSVYGLYARRHGEEKTLSAGGGGVVVEDGLNQPPPSSGQA